MTIWELAGGPEKSAYTGGKSAQDGCARAGEMARYKDLSLCLQTSVQSDMAAHICNPSNSLGKWNVEMGESLES